MPVQTIPEAVVRSKVLVLSDGMTVDGAIEAMEAVGHDFYVSGSILQGLTAFGSVCVGGFSGEGAEGGSLRAPWRKGWLHAMALRQAVKAAGAKSTPW